MGAAASRIGQILVATAAIVLGVALVCATGGLGGWAILGYAAGFGLISAGIGGGFAALSGCSWDHFWKQSFTGFVSGFCQGLAAAIGCCVIGAAGLGTSFPEEFVKFLVMMGTGAVGGVAGLTVSCMVHGDWQQWHDYGWLKALGLGALSGALSFAFGGLGRLLKQPMKYDFVAQLRPEWQAFGTAVQETIKLLTRSTFGGLGQLLYTALEDRMHGRPMDLQRYLVAFSVGAASGAATFSHQGLDAALRAKAWQNPVLLPFNPVPEVVSYPTDHADPPPRATGDVPTTAGDDLDDDPPLPPTGETSADQVDGEPAAEPEPQSNIDSSSAASAGQEQPTELGSTSPVPDAAGPLGDGVDTDSAVDTPIMPTAVPAGQEQPLEPTSLPSPQPGAGSPLGDAGAASAATDTRTVPTAVPAGQEQHSEPGAVSPLQPGEASPPQDAGAADLTAADVSNAPTAAFGSVETPSHFPSATMPPFGDVGAGHVDKNVPEPPVPQPIAAFSTSSGPPRPPGGPPSVTTTRPNQGVTVGGWVPQDPGACQVESMGEGSEAEAEEHSTGAFSPDPKTVPQALRRPRGLHASQTWNSLADERRDRANCDNQIRIIRILADGSSRTSEGSTASSSTARRHPRQELQKPREAKVPKMPKVLVLQRDELEELEGSGVVIVQHLVHPGQTLQQGKRPKSSSGFSYQFQNCIFHKNPKVLGVIATKSSGSTLWIHRLFYSQGYRITKVAGTLSWLPDGIIAYTVGDLVVLECCAPAPVQHTEGANKIAAAPATLLELFVMRASTHLVFHLASDGVAAEGHLATDKEERVTGDDVASAAVDHLASLCTLNGMAGFRKSCAAEQLTVVLRSWPGQHATAPRKLQELLGKETTSTQEGHDTEPPAIKCAADKVCQTFSEIHIRTLNYLPNLEEDTALPFSSATCEVRDEEMVQLVGELSASHFLYQQAKLRAVQLQTPEVADEERREWGLGVLALHSALEKLQAIQGNSDWKAELQTKLDGVTWEHPLVHKTVNACRKGESRQEALLRFKEALGDQLSKVDAVDFGDFLRGLWDEICVKPSAELQRATFQIHAMYTTGTADEVEKSLDLRGFIDDINKLLKQHQGHDTALARKMKEADRWIKEQGEAEKNKPEGERSGLFPFRMALKLVQALFDGYELKTRNSSAIVTLALRGLLKGAEHLQGDLRTVWIGLAIDEFDLLSKVYDHLYAQPMSWRFLSKAVEGGLSFQSQLVATGLFDKIVQASGEPHFEAALHTAASVLRQANITPLKDDTAHGLSNFPERAKLAVEMAHTARSRGCKEANMTAVLLVKDLAANPPGHQEGKAKFNALMNDRWISWARPHLFKNHIEVTGKTELEWQRRFGQGGQTAIENATAAVLADHLFSKLGATIIPDKRDEEKVQAAKWQVLYFSVKCHAQESFSKLSSAFADKLIPAMSSALCAGLSAPEPLRWASALFCQLAWAQDEIAEQQVVKQQLVEEGTHARPRVGTLHGGASSSSSWSQEDPCSRYAWVVVQVLQHEDGKRVVQSLASASCQLRQSGVPEKENIASNLASVLGRLFVWRNPGDDRAFPPKAEDVMRSLQAVWSTVPEELRNCAPTMDQKQQFLLLLNLSIRLMGCKINLERMKIEQQMGHGITQQGNLATFVDRHEQLRGALQGPFQPWSERELVQAVSSAWAEFTDQLIIAQSLPPREAPPESEIATLRGLTLASAAAVWNVAEVVHLVRTEPEVCFWSGASAAEILQKIPEKPEDLNVLKVFRLLSPLEQHESLRGQLLDVGCHCRKVLEEEKKKEKEQRELRKIAMKAQKQIQDELATPDSRTIQAQRMHLLNKLQPPPWSAPPRIR